MRSASHAQFLGWRSTFTPNLFLSSELFVDATAGFIGASRHRPTFESHRATRISNAPSRVVQVGVNDAGEVESSSSARRGGQVMALDVNKSVTRGLLGSSTRIQTRTPVAKDQAKRYFGDRYYWLQLSELLRGSSGARPTSPACSARTSRAPAACTCRGRCAAATCGVGGDDNHRARARPRAVEVQGRV